LEKIGGADIPHQKPEPDKKNACRNLFFRGGSNVKAHAFALAFLFDHVGLVEAHHPVATTDLEAAAIEAGANDFEAVSSETNDDIPEGHAGARFITGSVTRASVYADAQYGILTAGPLPPHKVRIVMLLGLAHGMDGPAIQAWIDQIFLAA
jgi:hypothetical protein